MSIKQTKLERADRVAELNPEATLQKIGLQAGDVFCDIGAGSGLFTLPAARMAASAVYAVELDDAMLEIIRQKAQAEGLPHIHTVKANGNDPGLPANTVDVAMLATVLHEIADKPAFLTNIHRLLKPCGRLAVIEFQDGQTPLGPPPTHRMSREQVVAALQDVNMHLIVEYDLGPNFRCLVFGKSC